MSKTAQLDKKAQSEVPDCKTGNPADYFQQCAGFLRQAGVSKKQGDLEGAYMNLKKYFILVNERLPQNPATTTKCKEEYYFNVEKCNTLKPELDNLRTQIDKSASASKPLPPPPTQGKPLPPPPTKSTEAPQPAADSNSGLGSMLSSWGSSLFGTKKELPPPPQATPTTTARTLPPPPSKDHQQPPFDSSLKPHEQFVMNQASKVVMNDAVQEKMGSAVAKLAQNEQVQAKMADSVKHLAQNKDYQKQMGSMIANQSDNVIVKQLAQNEKVQAAMGSAIANTIGNKDVQKKVGSAIAHAATDKETQKKVASGLLALGKVALQGGKLAGKAAIATTKFAATTGVAAYQEYQKQEQLKKEQEEQ